MKLTLKTITPLTMLMITLGLSSCANMMTNRTFIDEMEHESGYWVPGQDFQTTAGDTGQAYRTSEEINHRTPASYYDQQNYQESESIRRELVRRESMLNEREFMAYREAQNHFTSDSERIYYLSLAPYERERYLETKSSDSGSSLSGRSPASLNSYVNYPKSHQMQTLELIQPAVPDYGPDLNVGMGKDQVVEMWGRPARIDVAGDPRHQNERWSFHQNGQLKTVYFENGQVEGWSLQ